MSSTCRPWYAEGLHFSCTQCGHCCRIEGHVWVDQEEILAAARHLDLDPDTFGSRFLRRIDTRISLTEKPNHDCVFWQGGCSIYPVRPRQCRTFPFWDQHLENTAAWKTAARECEGIGQGRLYRLLEIETLCTGEGATVNGEKDAEG